MLLERLEKLEQRFQEIEQELLQVGDDYKRAAALAKERSELEPIVTKAREYRKALEQLEEARTILEEEDDPELKELARAEIDELEARIAALEREIKRLLLPKDPRDEKNVIMEIRAGAGGEEAALFAAAGTRNAKAGTWKCSPSTRRAWMGTRKSSSSSRARVPSPGSSTSPGSIGFNGSR